jgi:hypothetical protein
VSICVLSLIIIRPLDQGSSGPVTWSGVADRENRARCGKLSRTSGVRIGLDFLFQTGDDLAQLRRIVRLADDFVDCQFLVSADVLGGKMR